MEEEIDLSKYVEILIRRWYLAVVPAFMLGIIVGTWIMLQPRRYQAQVLIAATKLTTQVSYGTAIKTASEDVSRVLADRNQRLASFVELVRSPNVAEAVISALGEALPVADRALDPLLKSVSGRIVPKSDMIEIKVTHRDPEVAREIATAWAREYIRQVNTIYGDVATEPYEIIKGQVPDARLNYDKAQTELEALLRENRQGELQRQISELTTVIESVRLARSSGVSMLVDELQRLDQLLQSAQDMRDQVHLGGLASANANSLVLTALRLRAAWRLPDSDILSRSSAPFVFQIQAPVPATNYAEMVGDLDALIQVLQNRRTALLTQWTSLSQALSEGNAWGFSASTSQTKPDDGQIGQTLDTLERQVRTLTAEMEQAKGRLKEVTAQRDLAWETYNNVLRKEVELALAVATAGAELRLGTLAVVSPEARGLAKSVATAVVAGLMLGIFGAFALEFWQGYRARTTAGAGGTGPRAGLG